MNWKGIQVWGDSVLKGVVFDSGRNRYCVLKENAVSRIAQATELPLSNCARMGSTAPQALERMQQAPDQFKDQLVLIEYGGNDCDFDWKAVAAQPEKPHQPHTPVHEFEEALRRMVAFVRQCGGVPLMTTLPPLDAPRYLSWIVRRDQVERAALMRFLGDVQRIYRWQELYNFAILRVAASVACPCVALREKFLNDLCGQDLLCVDGIHPNAEGHKLMANYFVEQLAGV